MKKYLEHLTTNKKSILYYKMSESITFSGPGQLALLNREIAEIEQAELNCSITISTIVDNNFAFAVTFVSDLYSAKFIANNNVLVDAPSFFALNNNIKYTFSLLEDSGNIYVYLNANGNYEGNQFDITAILAPDLLSRKSKMLSKLKTVKKCPAVAAKLAALKKKQKESSQTN